MTGKAAERDAALLVRGVKIRASCERALHCDCSHRRFLSLSLPLSLSLSLPFFLSHSFIFFSLTLPPAATPPIKGESKKDNFYQEKKYGFKKR